MKTYLVSVSDANSGTLLIPACIVRAIDSSELVSKLANRLNDPTVGLPFDGNAVATFAEIPDEFLNDPKMDIFRLTRHSAFRQFTVYARRRNPAIP